MVLRALLKVQLGWGALQRTRCFAGWGAREPPAAPATLFACCTSPALMAVSQPALPQRVLQTRDHVCQMAQNGPNRPRCPSAPSACVDDCPKFALIMVAQLSLVLPTPVWTTSPPPPPRDLQTGAGIANGMVLLPLNRVASFLQTCRAELAVALFGVWPTQLAKPLTVHSVSNHDLFVS